MSPRSKTAHSLVAHINTCDAHGISCPLNGSTDVWVTQVMFGH